MQQKPENIKYENNCAVVCDRRFLAVHKWLQKSIRMVLVSYNSKMIGTIERCSHTVKSKKAVTKCYDISNDGKFIVRKRKNNETIVLNTA